MSNAGTDAQQVSRLLLQPVTPAGAPVVDETTWITSERGRFLVADHTTPGAIYIVTRNGGFGAPSAYSTVGNDSPTLTSTLSTLDTASGLLTPVVSGFKSPKGLLFQPQP